MTENEIRRIPEVYGRDKVKEDVGRVFLHSIQRICPCCKSRSEPAWWDRKRRGEKYEEGSESVIANSF